MHALSLESGPRRLLWRQWVDRWLWAGSQSGAGKRPWLTCTTLLWVLIIGIADFLLRVEISLLVFYFIPIALAVVARGRGFGLLIALVCVTTWIAGDWFGGAQYSSPFVPIWNAGIAVATYLVLIILLSRLLDLQRDLEERVRVRTAALSDEMAERERLEKALLAMSERERLAIGHDLHDGLGQHLTGTALTGQLLVEKLLERNAEEVADARRLVSLVKQAVEQTRTMAKGLLLAEIDAESLPDTLREFCVLMAEQFRIACPCRCEGLVLLPENGTASHLYRIAQEAVRNAIRHGGAKRVDVELSVKDGLLLLAIRDNGTGLPPAEERGEGLGLGIMAHRAGIIGAKFQIESNAPHGTLVTCRWPLPVS